MLIFWFKYGQFLCLKCFNTPSLTYVPVDKKFQCLHFVYYWRGKLGKQKSALQNIKILFKVQETVIKSFDEYSNIAFETYETIHGKSVLYT